MREPPKLTMPTTGEPWGNAVSRFTRELTDVMAWMQEAVEVVEAARKADDAGRRYGEPSAAGRGCILAPQPVTSDEDERIIAHLHAGQGLHTYDYSVDSQENVLARVNAWRCSLHEQAGAVLNGDTSAGRPIRLTLNRDAHVTALYANSFSRVALT